MSERLLFSTKALRVAAAALVITSCNSDNSNEEGRPNLTAAVVQDDLEGHSNEYSFAYGIGLRAGCDSDEFLEGTELKGETSATEAYKEVFQRQPGLFLALHYFLGW